MAIPIRKCVAHIIIIYTQAAITTIKHLLIHQYTGDLYANIILLPIAFLSELIYNAIISSRYNTTSMPKIGISIGVLPRIMNFFAPLKKYSMESPKDTPSMIPLCMNLTAPV